MKTKSKFTKFRAASLVALGVLFLSGCWESEGNETKIQFMPDMADVPVVKPQLSYIDPPENSVAVNAIIYPEDWSIAEKEFRSPYKKGFGNYEDVLVDGKKLYNTYCAVCHGEDGKGEGYLGTSYPIPVADITREELAARGDGHFFMQITRGGAMMPGYGHAISPIERWQIVAYLRQLQGK